MTQEFLDELGMLVLGEQDRGAGVPEVVEADLGHIGLFQERLEGAVHQVVSVHRRTGC